MYTYVCWYEKLYLSTMTDWTFIFITPYSRSLLTSQLQWTQIYTHCVRSLCRKTPRWWWLITPILYIYVTHCPITQRIIKQHEFLPTYIVHLITGYVVFQICCSSSMIIVFRCANSFHLLKEPDAGSCKIESTGTVTYIHAWTSEWKGDVILSGSYRTYILN